MIPSTSSVGVLLSEPLDLTCEQVLDRHALGLIYCGAIRYWDDAAIKAPNTAAVQALLPHQPILVGYSDNAGISVPAVFKGALSSFSQEFADALAAANDTFALMFPDNTTGQAAGSSGSARVTWTQVPSSWPDGFELESLRARNAAHY